MNTAVALFLPLIGGFLFATRVDFIKYELAREHGHRFYFRIGYCGFFLFVISFFVVYLLNWLWEGLPYKDAFHAWAVDGLSPLLEESQRADVKFRLWLTCICAVLLGRFSPCVVNRFAKEKSQQALRNAVKDDALEAMLIDAIAERKTIAITTPMRKVYVGWPIGTAEPNAARKSVALLPMVSGYRDAEGEVHLTTSYAWAYGDKDSPKAGNFRIVLPVDQIASISFFDLTIYAGFIAQHNGEQGKEETRDAESATGDLEPQ